MQKVTGIGGLFFRSQDPEGVAAWYARHLGVSMDNGPWRQDAGYTVFQPFAADTDYFAADQGWMMNFRVEDLDAMVAQLEAAGVVVIQDPAWNSAVGRFARIHDPEGRPIELWEPSAITR